MLLFLNNRYVDEKECTLSYQDRGFLLGDGFFTTLLWHPPQLMRFQKHYERLKRTACFFQLPFHLSSQDLYKHCLTLVKNNNLIKQKAALRITMTRGTSSRGLLPSSTSMPTLLITTYPYSSPQTPFTLTLSRFRRYADPLLSQYKHLGYQSSFFAKKEAHKNGFDDALMFNQFDQVVSVTCGNLFIIQRNQIFTPPLSSGALAGITRASIQAIIRPLTIDDIYQAEALFITNSLLGLHPIKQVNRHFYDISHPKLLQLKDDYEAC